MRFIIFIKKECKIICYCTRRKFLFISNLNAQGYKNTKQYEKAELVTFGNKESKTVFKLSYPKHLNCTKHKECTTAPYFKQSLALRHRILAFISATEFYTKWTRHSERIYHMHLQQIINKIREKCVRLLSKNGRSR